MLSPISRIRYHLPGKRALVVGAAVTALALSVACGGGGASSSNAPTIGVSERDFTISLDQTTIASGKVSFSVANSGPSTHEFVVFRTDLTPTALPTKDNEVDEEGQGLTAVDEIEGIKAGTSKRLTLDLAPGHYVLICNIPTHYQAGMRAELTVS